MRIKYLLCGIILILSWMGQNQAGAGISVAPASIKMAISEDNHIIPITIKNPGHEALEYRIYANSLGQGLDGDAISLNNADMPYSLVRLIKFNPNRFTLEANGSQTVEAAVQIPDVSGGGLYGMIYIEAKPVSSDGPSTGDIAYVSRVGVVTLLTLPGEAVRDAFIAAVELVQCRPGEELQILSTFHNTGNIHLRPEGVVIIRNQAGERVAKVLVKPCIILPNYSRPLIARWKPENLQIGTYTAETLLTFDGKPLVFRQEFTVINLGEIALIRGEIASFSYPTTIQHTPICFDLLFCNKGNVNLPLRGEIEIKCDNNIIERAFITPDEVIAHSSRGLKATIDRGLPMGTYMATAMVKYADKIATTTINLTVLEKEIIYAGEIVEWTIPKLAAGKVSIPLNLLFKNTGNVTLKVEGMIELENGQGITVGQVIIESRTMEPDKTERLRTIWQGELPPGLYHGVASLILGDGGMVTKKVSFLVVR